MLSIDTSQQLLAFIYYSVKAACGHNLLFKSIYCNALLEKIIYIEKFHIYYWNKIGQPAAHKWIEQQLPSLGRWVLVNTELWVLVSYSFWQTQVFVMKQVIFFIHSVCIIP